MNKYLSSRSVLCFHAFFGEKTNTKFNFTSFEEEVGEGGGGKVAKENWIKNHVFLRSKVPSTLKKVCFARFLFLPFFKRNMSFYCNPQIPNPSSTTTKSQYKNHKYQQKWKGTEHTKYIRSMENSHTFSYYYFFVRHTTTWKVYFPFYIFHFFSSSSSSTAAIFSRTELLLLMGFSLSRISLHQTHQIDLNSIKEKGTKMCALTRSGIMYNNSWELSL